MYSLQPNVFLAFLCIHHNLMYSLQFYVLFLLYILMNSKTYALCILWLYFKHLDTFFSNDDTESHLLQGVRLSTEFINSLMWFASLSNLTKYYGSARVLDTTINGTISYEPPLIRVQEDNLLTVSIGKGLLLAECLPSNDNTKKVHFSEKNG